MGNSPTSASSSYHLDELAVALDPSSPSHILPEIGRDQTVVLDIGCGAGQSLIAITATTEHLLIGVDIDEAALRLGQTLTEQVRFTVGRAEQLPFRSGAFDLVISRVALPYTDIPRSLAEIARLLRPGGTCWLLLHPLSFGGRELVRELRAFRVKGILYQLYVLANALALHFFGRQFAYPLRRSRFESTQTVRGMRRAARSAGFDDVHVQHGRFFVCTARKA